MRNKILKFEITSKLSARARTFIFSDPRSKALLPLIERTASSDATILISGETGTGKELVARYVHQMSERANKSFVAVNCGAFSETLIESELFGHERGAFTGALNAREGWFEAANGGTLFLDEVGDLSHPLQVKLLRILQEREVVRIGARQPVSLDVRLIAATNVNLLEAVNAGRFREDLYYRLSVVSLPLLPLRERRADILPLARHFLTSYSDKINAPIISFTPDAEEAIFNHAWPGNIRELENVIQRATLVCSGHQIEYHHLGLAADHQGNVPQASHIPQQSQAFPATTASLAERGGGNGIEEIQAILSKLIINGEPDLLNRLLDATVRAAYDISNQNQVRTAQSLGVTRNVIRTYLKNAGLIANE